MAKYCKFKQGDRVRLHTLRYGVSFAGGPDFKVYTNPTWGHDGKFIGGTVTSVENTGKYSGDIKVEWDDTGRNDYDAKDLRRMSKADEAARTTVPPAPEPVAPAKAPRVPMGTPPSGYRFLVEGEVTQVGDIVWSRAHPEIDVKNDDVGADGSTVWLNHRVGNCESDLDDYPFLRPVNTSEVTIPASGVTWTLPCNPDGTLTTQATLAPDGTKAEPDPAPLGVFNLDKVTAEVSITFGEPRRTVSVSGNADGSVYVQLNLGEEVRKGFALTAEAARNLHIALGAVLP